MFIKFIDVEEAVSAAGDFLVPALVHVPVVVELGLADFKEFVEGFSFLGEVFFEAGIDAGPVFDKGAKALRVAPGGAGVGDENVHLFAPFGQVLETFVGPVAFEWDAAFSVYGDSPPYKLECFVAPGAEAIVFEELEVAEGNSVRFRKVFWVTVVSSQGKEGDVSFLKFFVEFFTE
jgi:hypothetical protein